MTSDPTYVPKHSAAGAVTVPATNGAHYAAGHREPSVATNGHPNPAYVDGGMNAVMSQFSALGINGPGMGANSVSMGMNPMLLSPPFGFLNDGTAVFSGGIPPSIAQMPGQVPIPPEQPYYVTPQGYAYPTTWMPASREAMIHNPAALRELISRYEPEKLSMPQHDVPGLENRRASYSTNESTPATPAFFGSTASRDPSVRVAVFERSTFTTPSPQQITSNGIAQQPKGFATIGVAPDDRDLGKLINMEPPIPQAVPAVFTPQENMKTLEQSLSNPIPGNRNVYIRGLHPTTDDELLYKFAERFGRVETSKAIIDTATGACKGFGFAKFYNVRDSDACIRGFHQLGYEVGFARESFNSRLKAEGDESSTNLYISNLPKTVTENELATIFIGFTILSSKILRDGLGNSRGVGFARFENRETCDEVIKQFQGQPLGDEGLAMSIRYADTPSQKELKRVTAERRQFRTNEYNVGAYGTPLVGMSPTIYNQPGYRRGGGGGMHTASVDY